MSALGCELAGRCGGCGWHDRDLETGRRDKTAELTALLGPHLGELRPAMVTPASHAFRERLDLRLDEGRLGLIALDRSGVVDMARCPLVVPALEAFLGDLRADLPPVPRASLRLRVHDHRRGLWLDLPHVSIKALLDEGAWLARWAPTTTLELGPKSRAVTVEGGAPRLVDPPLLPWATTTSGAIALDLCGTVQGFSQPGPVPNRALVEAVLAALASSDAQRVVELGAGAGNLSLPIALAGYEVRAVELDTRALAATLAHNQGALGLARQRVTAVAGSFEREAEVPALLAGVDTIVCDPPRSGLGRFVDGLARLSPGLRPTTLLYVSCHPAALAQDVTRLAPLGYRLDHLAGVDQFPWTPHAEWVARLTR